MLVAALAMSALVASAAQAVPYTGLDGSSKNVETVIHGTQVGSHSFTAGSGFGAITCSTAVFDGLSATGNSSTLSITPTYSGCKDSFSRTVDVTMEGCTYLFNTPSGSGSTYTGSVNLVCPAGKSVIIHVTSSPSTVACTVTVHAQTNLTSNHYENIAGSPSTVTVKTDITNLQTTTSGGFFNCGVTDGTHNDGSYVGHSTVSGKTTAGAALSVKIN